LYKIVKIELLFLHSKSDRSGETREIGFPFVVLHGNLESAFSMEITRNDMDMEMRDALTGDLTNVSKDIDPFGA
jgi:hypothetical protein